MTAKSQKIGKNFALPRWVIELLEIEASRYDGPGVVSAAAIYLFHRLSDEDQAEALQAYHARQIEVAQGDHSADREFRQKALRYRPGAKGRARKATGSKAG